MSTWKNGIMKGLDTTWSLAKIVFPVTLAVSILKYTPVIHFLTRILEPLMGLFGLSGDSAIVLVLGNVLNLYAAVGAILTMELTVKQVFLLAIMLSLSHNLIVETAITTRIGVKPWIMALLRLFLAFVFAFVLNLIWSGGQDIAQYGLISAKTQVLNNWSDILMNAVQTAFLGILQIAMIVIPVMIMIQILKDINVLPLLAKLLSPFTRVLGVSDKTGVTLLAGILFGIAYGAGVIIQTAKEENLSKKDLYLVSIFLVSCHAVIEDTLIFIPLGINVLPLLLIRVALAFVVTAVTASFWKKIDQRKVFSEPM
ncbi:MAG: hypothetical protein GX434_11825 [Peptococcaceae bacterium]|nr:hypothetical protein [Peptococcaceae bacterium]